MMALKYTLLVMVKMVNAAALISNSTTLRASSTTSSAASLITNPSSAGSCGSCTINGGDVHVYWWATASDGQQISTKIVNEANFTFNSPSIYLAFSTLFTEDACSTGPVLPATTIAFRQDELSTATGWKWNTEEYISRPPRVNTDYILATWVRNQLETCTYITTSFLQPLDGPYQNKTFSDPEAIRSSYAPGDAGTTFVYDPASFSEYTVSYNPCSPTLSAPQEIYTLEPGWSNCVRAVNGLWDPPYALTPVTTHAATSSSTTQSVKSTAASAVQGSTPSPGIASPTSTATKTPTPQPTASQATSIKSTSEQSKPAQRIPDPTTQLEISKSTQAVQSTSDHTTPISSPIPFVVIGSQTVTAGKASATISGTVFSLQTDGSSLVIGSNTVAVTSLLPSITVPTYAIGSQTLTPGVDVTIKGGSGTSVVRLQSGGLSAVVGGNTIPVTQLAGVTVVPASTTPKYVIGSQTLVPGASGITLTGAAGASVVSLEAGGASVVVGGSTIPVTQLSGLTTATAAGIGNIVLSMDGYSTSVQSAPGKATGAAGAGGYNGTIFTGAAAPRQIGTCGLGLSVMMMLLKILL